MHLPFRKVANGMTSRVRPYIGQCGFCGQGLLRVMRCKSCQAVIVLCDECELLWSDPVQVAQDPQVRSSGAFPACPHCGTDPSEFEFLNVPQLGAYNLESYIQGLSF